VQKLEYENVTHFEAMLQPLSAFVDLEDLDLINSIEQTENLDRLQTTYWYEGRCPKTGIRLRLPRTPLSETIAHALMRELAIQNSEASATSNRTFREGKMYGVLLVETSDGEPGVLKAFSGLLQGQSTVAGWVPPIPGRDRLVWTETQTLAQLDAIKQELLALKQMPERQQYAALSQDFEQRFQQLYFCQQQRKQQRQQQRQALSEAGSETLSAAALTLALAQLDHQSRQDSRERRNLKQQREMALRSIKQAIDQADVRIQELKQQRKALSQQLQAQMHTVYCLTNFAGESVSLQQLVAGGTMPTGTGECCAPKLLHYAATHNLKPVAMAEFWWGNSSANGDKVAGEFYGACEERCQPLMGFLLSGLSAEISRFPVLPVSKTTGENFLLPILYEDEWLIAVNKPAGLLSVPGRSSDRQDSVLSRLQQTLPNSAFLATVHRLDQDTSGILLLARDRQTKRHLSQQFEQRQVHKVYEAILAGQVMPGEGIIDLPIWGNPADRPRQTVNWQYGKSSVTQFRVLKADSDVHNDGYNSAKYASRNNSENSQTHTHIYTRIEFIPVTGRTHQLRVHAADSRGLGVPICGDRLYGHSNHYQNRGDRLYLHAKELQFIHPQTGQQLCLKTHVPF